MPDRVEVPIVVVAPLDQALWIEGGAFWVAKNEIRIPAAGTSVGFKSLAGSGARGFFRLNYVQSLAEKRGFRVMCAPLNYSGTGQLSRTTEFNGKTFLPGIDTKGTYRFNSYRVSYWTTPRGIDARWNLRLGITLKVRDASVGLSQSGVASHYDDVGVVPLFYASGERALGPRWNFMFDFDGFAVPMGRAIDLGLYLAYAISPQTSVTIGARALDGGADNDKVFNAATFTYLSVGVGCRF